MSTMIPLSLLISLDGGGIKISLQWHTPRIWGNKRKAQENKNYRQFFIDFPTRRHDDVHFYWIMKEQKWVTEVGWKRLCRERWFKRGKKGAMMNADFFASSYFIPFSTMIFSTSFIIFLYMHNFHFTTHFSL